LAVTRGARGRREVPSTYQMINLSMILAFPARLGAGDCSMWCWWATILLLPKCRG